MIDANDTHEQDDKAFEELLSTNSQLHDELNALKQKFKQYVHYEEFNQLKIVHEQIVEQNKCLVKDKQAISKTCDTLTKERDTAVEEQNKAK